MQSLRASSLSRTSLLKLSARLAARRRSFSEARAAAKEIMPKELTSVPAEEEVGLASKASLTALSASSTTCSVLTASGLSQAERSLRITMGDRETAGLSSEGVGSSDLRLISFGSMRGVLGRLARFCGWQSDGLLC